ncbi:MAG: helix-turn-helix transcriptional regulator [Pseudomonadota bacterium]
MTIVEAVKLSDENRHGDISRGVSDLMACVGARVKDSRRQKKMSRRVLSEISEVSPRYLAQLENGDGNISIGLLKRIAIALGTPIEYFLSDDEILATETATISSLFRSADTSVRAKVLQLLDPDRPANSKAERICLIGLRGAGKSTLGPLLAAETGSSFIELTSQIEKRAGMPTAEIIALYGQEGYRELEASALNDVVNSKTRVILAAAGGVVADEEAFQMLLSCFHTIWLKANPSDHMQRVREQGDLRPMEGNPQAMVQLRLILQSREAQYQKADYVIDTSNKSVETSKSELRDLILKNRLLAALKTENE